MKFVRVILLSIIVFLGNAYGDSWEVISLVYDFKLLAEAGKVSEAEDFGNRVMRYWLSQDSMKTKEGFKHKIDFAVMTEDEGSFNRLIERLSSDHNGALRKYARGKRAYFRMETLQGNGDGAIEILIGKIHVGRELYNRRWSGDKALAAREFRGILSELYKNEELKGIMDALAAHAKINPYFRLNVFDQSPVHKGYAGMYCSQLMQVDVYTGSISSEKSFRGTLIHEWSHQLMDILFSNEMRPHYGEDRNYKKAMQETRKRVADCKNTQAKHLLTEVTDHPIYDQSDQEIEYIVRYPEVLARGELNGREAEHLYQPLKGYWNHNVQARIREYLTRG